MDNDVREDVYKIILKKNLCIKLVEKLVHWLHIFKKNKVTSVFNK